MGTPSGHLDHAFTIINTGFDLWDFLKGNGTLSNGYVSMPMAVLRHLSSMIVLAKAESRQVRRGFGWRITQTGWMSKGSIDSRAYLATWVSLIPKSDIEDLWDELKLALKGMRVKIESPIAMVLATKNAGDNYQHLLNRHKR